MVATTVKWAGAVEASPVRYAHLLAPGDWIVCAQSGLRDLSPPYAMFFTGDKLVHYRIAVEIDDCRRAPYATALAGQAGYETGQPVGQPVGSLSGIWAARSSSDRDGDVEEKRKREPGR